VTGRKSLGTLPKRLILKWIEKRDDAALFRASVGNDPSLADIIKMVHPKPATKSREALFSYLIGRPYNAAELTEIARQYEAFKAGGSKLVPDVPFQTLTHSAETMPTASTTLSLRPNSPTIRLPLPPNVRFPAPPVPPNHAL